MSKKTAYFSHDSNSRNDEKILAVRMRLGAEGYGIYFMILERLRDESDYMSIKDYNLLAFDFRVGSDKVKAVIEDFGLFQFTDDGCFFFSDSFLERMNIVDEKSVKARESAQKRWNGVRTQCERNANVPKNDANKLKETKLKESNKDISPVPGEVSFLENPEIPLSPVKDKKIEKEKSCAEKEKEVFEKFRAAYTGSKRGHETEWLNFSKKTKDYKAVLPLLLPAFDKLSQWRVKTQAAGLFCPSMPNLQTWINQRRWEVELPEIKTQQNGTGKSNQNTSRNSTGETPTTNNGGSQVPERDYD